MESELAPSIRSAVIMHATQHINSIAKTSIYALLIVDIIFFFFFISNTSSSFRCCSCRRRRRRTHWKYYCMIRVAVESVTGVPVCVCVFVSVRESREPTLPTYCISKRMNSFFLLFHTSPLSKPHDKPSSSIYFLDIFHPPWQTNIAENVSVSQISRLKDAEKKRWEEEESHLRHDFVCRKIEIFFFRILSDQINEKDDEFDEKEEKATDDDDGDDNTKSTKMTTTNE